MFLRWRELVFSAATVTKKNECLRADVNVKAVHFQCEVLQYIWKTFCMYVLRVCSIANIHFGKAGSNKHNSQQTSGQSRPSWSSTNTSTQAADWRGREWGELLPVTIYVLQLLWPAPEENWLLDLLAAGWFGRMFSILAPFQCLVEVLHHLG